MNDLPYILKFIDDLCILLRLNKNELDHSTTFVSQELARIQNLINKIGEGSLPPQIRWKIQIQRPHLILPCQECQRMGLFRILILLLCLLCSCGTYRSMQRPVKHKNTW